MRDLRVRQCQLIRWLVDVGFELPAEERMKDRRDEKPEKVVPRRRHVSFDVDRTMVGDGVRVNAR